MTYDDHYHRTLGAYCGYPQCCVDFFLTNRYPADVVGPGPWEGTGFIPCPSCAATIRSYGFEPFVAMRITPNRLAPRRFPDLGSKEDVEAIQRRIDEGTMNIRGVARRSPTGRTLYPCAGTEQHENRCRRTGPTPSVVALDFSEIESRIVARIAGKQKMRRLFPGRRLAKGEKARDYLEPHMGPGEPPHAVDCLFAGEVSLDELQRAVGRHQLRYGMDGAGDGDDLLPRDF